MIALALVVVLAATTAFWFSRNRELRQVRLDDGSLLLVNSVSCAQPNRFLHGKPVEKLLGNTIPANGLRLAKLQLARPIPQVFPAPSGKSELVVELKLVGRKAATHSFVKPAFPREYRCVFSGESGFEFVEELREYGLNPYSDGYFRYIVARRFPRDSRWLRLRIEKRQTMYAGGPWTLAAEFKFRNPAHPANRPWTADPPGTPKKVGGMEFALTQLTVQTQAYAPRDIWNHVVTSEFQVSTNGLALTNWSARYGYVQVEDASGNWDTLASHRSLDPKFVWKLEADFEPESGFAADRMATLPIPAKLTSAIITNIAGVPISIWWANGNTLMARIPTNDPSIGLRLLGATDEKGQKINWRSTGESQFSFSMSFMPAPPTLTPAPNVNATIAIVPNVHATFYSQPPLITKSDPH